MGNWTTRRASFPPTTSRPWTISSHCPAPDVSVHTCCLCTCVWCFWNGQPFGSLKHFTSPLFASLSHKRIITTSLLTLTPFPFSLSPSHTTSLLTLTPPHFSISHHLTAHCHTTSLHSHTTSLLTLIPPHCSLSHHLTLHCHTTSLSHHLTSYHHTTSLSHHLTSYHHTTSLLTLTPLHFSLSHQLTPPYSSLSHYLTQANITFILISQLHIYACVY